MLIKTIMILVIVIFLTTIRTSGTKSMINIYKYDVNNYDIYFK